MGIHLNQVECLAHKFETMRAGKLCAVLAGVFPVATSLPAFAVLCERLPWRQVVAVGIAIAGIICLIPG